MASETKSNPFDAILRPLASLRLTVVLFAFALVLVFYGTLAQKEDGIWVVVDRYFRSAYVWIPMKVLSFFLVSDPEGPLASFALPFPGGWTLGGLMMANLFAAHVTKLRTGSIYVVTCAIVAALSWETLQAYVPPAYLAVGATVLLLAAPFVHALLFGQVRTKYGVLLIHSGLIVMMLSELITGVYAIEGNMTIREGTTSNYLEHHQFPELTFIKKVGDQDRVVTASRVTGSRGFLEDGMTVSHSELPFDVEVLDAYRNSAVFEILDPEFKNPATHGAGTEQMAVRRPEVSGTDPDQKVDTPSAYVRLKNKKTGDSLGVYLVSVLVYDPQTVTVDGVDWRMSLRFKRTYQPYAFFLRKFDHKVFRGTTIPKDFRSHVTVTDTRRPGFELKTEIYMNHPLRFNNETFYQASFMGSSVTVLQVVRNPGWTWPYVACVVVGLGLLWHFLQHLFQFIERSVKA